MRSHPWLTCIIIWAAGVMWVKVGEGRWNVAKRGRGKKYDMYNIMCNIF
jgi:hypothetical protein